MSKGTMIGVALAVAAVVLVLAGVPVGRLLTVLLVLACPLMMVFMHRGHRRHASHGGQTTKPRDERLETKQSVPRIGGASSRFPSAPSERE